MTGLLLLGSGRHRDVYALDNFKVLKVAKDNLGIVQNTVEKEVSEKSNFVAKVYSINSNGSIIVERADKCTVEIFEKLTHINFNEFKQIVELKEKTLNKKQNKIFTSIKLNILENKYIKNIFLKNFFKLIKECNYGGCIGDFKKISSFGVIKERVVPIDYGYYKI